MRKNKKLYLFFYLYQIYKIKKTSFNGYYVIKKLALFYDIVKSAFEGRRKMIKTSLKPYLSAKDFSVMNLKPNLRAEDLTVNDYIFISDYVQKI